MGRTSKKFSDHDAVVLQNMRIRKSTDEKARRERKKAAEAAGLPNLFSQALRIGSEIARWFMKRGRKQTDCTLEIGVIDGQLTIVGQKRKRPKKNPSANEQFDLFKWSSPQTEEPEA
ncbi:MAG: hypothetical protein CFE34_06700 [Rhodobacteraceae bacterium PARR1]|nr:MAG: hypothetical protein CFE34_06700 [Rhodobacteraceae bacterium PARR1]